MHERGMKKSKSVEDCLIDLIESMLEEKDED